MGNAGLLFLSRHVWNWRFRVFLVIHADWSYIRWSNDHRDTTKGNKRKKPNGGIQLSGRKKKTTSSSIPSKPDKISRQVHHDAVSSRRNSNEKHTHLQKQTQCSFHIFICFHLLCSFSGDRAQANATNLCFFVYDFQLPMAFWEFTTRGNRSWPPTNTLRLDHQ